MAKNIWRMAFSLIKKGFALNAVFLLVGVLLGAFFTAFGMQLTRLDELVMNPQMLFASLFAVSVSILLFWAGVGFVGEQLFTNKKATQVLA